MKKKNHIFFILFAVATVPGMVMASDNSDTATSSTANSEINFTINVVDPYNFLKNGLQIYQDDKQNFCSNFDLTNFSENGFTVSNLQGDCGQVTVYPKSPVPECYELVDGSGDNQALRFNQQSFYQAQVAGDALSGKCEYRFVNSSSCTPDKKINGIDSFTYNYSVSGRTLTINVSPTESQ